MGDERRLNIILQAQSKVSHQAAKSRGAHSVTNRLVREWNDFACIKYYDRTCLGRYSRFITFVALAAQPNKIIDVRLEFYARLNKSVLCPIGARLSTPISISSIIHYYHRMSEAERCLY
jgi:hypothetical protein